jgi:hypothetical protein
MTCSNSRPFKVNVAPDGLEWEKRYQRNENPHASSPHIEIVLEIFKIN